MSWYFPAKSRLTHSARPTCWKHCTVRLPSRSAACKPGAPPSDQREYSKPGILNTAPKPVFTAYVQPVYHADGSDDVTRYRRPMAISTAWMLLMPSEDDLRRVTTRGYRSTGVELVSDLNLLHFPENIKAGLRYAYRLDYHNARLQPFLAFTF